MLQVLLVVALCIDAFTASFSYGINKTKIPILSIIVISFICSVVLAISTGIGSMAKHIIPSEITGVICFIILFILGIVKSTECLIKQYIQKNQQKKSKIKLKLFDLNFVITVYADNIKADIDDSKVLSSKEAVYLALALSLDGFAAGFGWGLTNINYFQIVLLSLISNILAVSLGYFLGKILTRLIKYDFSWFGGIMLIILAFTKLR